MIKTMGGVDWAVKEEPQELLHKQYTLIQDLA